MTAINTIITGANSGIGYETALHFARGGAHVVMACRNPDKAAKAQSDLHAAVPDAKTTILRLDVSDLDSVREFSQQFAAQIGQLDLLINNAGIVAIPLSRNSAGHETQLATNHLGAFALTGLLLPCFRKDRATRIVNVGSLAHRLGKLNVDDLNWEHTPYNQWKSYANSKVATLSFSMELNRRLKQCGSNIVALAAHPGFANTNIHVNSPALTRTHPISVWMHEQNKALIPTAATAAKSVIFAAGSNEVLGGEYYGPSGFLEIRGKPGRAHVNPAARNTELGKRLWTVSEEMTGVHYLSDL